MNESFRPNRRTVTAGLAALPLGLTACNASPSSQRIIVIGAGIIGASAAYYLTKAGARVTLLDRHDLATRSSRGTFAWLNASWAKQPRAYHALNQAGIAGWKALQTELGIPIRWGGSMEWFENEARQAKLALQIDEQITWGEPARMIARDALESMEPEVDFRTASRAAFSGNDGALDPVFATKTLAEAAQARGCKIITNCEVKSVRATNSGVRLETSHGPLSADRYVLATGADPVATQALADIDIPQRSTPGIIVVTKPMPQILGTILVAPGVHIHQREDGRIVLGEQDRAPDTAQHAQRLINRPNRFPDDDHALMHAQRILAVAETYLPAIASADVEDVLIGWRPLPLDGHPVLGPSPDAPRSYLAITHSGVTLAPIIGQHIATEIMTGEKVKRLAPYRPDRTFDTIKRY